MSIGVALSHCVRRSLQSKKGINYVETLFVLLSNGRGLISGYEPLERFF